MTLDGYGEFRDCTIKNNKALQSSIFFQIDTVVNICVIHNTDIFDNLQINPVVFMGELKLGNLPDYGEHWMTNYVDFLLELEVFADSLEFGSSSSFNLIRSNLDITGCRITR